MKVSVKNVHQPLQRPGTMDYLTKNVTVLEKVKRAKRISMKVLPPTEETILKLNQLGQQYPFCVNYKQKRHDPL